MKTLFGKTFQVMQKALELRSKANAVIASNIANVDTPGYKEKALNFRQIMEGYLKELEAKGPNASLSSQAQAPFIPLDGKGQPELPLLTTDPRHVNSGGSFEPLEITESSERGVPNNVDLDEQMAKLSENNLQYQAAIQLLVKKFELLREAATEGGRQ